MIRLLNIAEQNFNLRSDNFEQAFSFEEKRLLIDGYCSHNNTVCFKSNGKSGRLLLKKFCDDLFMNSNENLNEEFKVEELIYTLVQNYILSVDRDTNANILRIGIACLYRFVQLNWTGPELTEDEEVDLLKVFHENLKTKFGDKFTYDTNEMKKSIEREFDDDGALLHSNARNIELLVLAMHIFVSAAAVFPSGYWWLMRCFMVQQQLFQNPISYTYQKLNVIYEQLKMMVKNSEDKLLMTLLNMEMIQIHLQICHNIVSANEILLNVLESVGLHTSLVGTLGKRTRFQNREISQLALEVSVVETEHMELYLPKFLHKMPRDLILTDEVRLPKIAYSDESAGLCPMLTEMQQAALLSTLMVIMKGKPHDELLLEELLPYVNCILSQPMHWSTQMSVLLLRSRVESSNRRTTERSLCQLESLLTDINSAEFPPCDRMPFFFCSYFVPKWEIETALARLLLAIGATKSALDIYLKLKQWEDVVYCYTALNMKHRAEEVIRKEMEENGETVKLWCALGDATDDEMCYEKAWALSNERSSLPMKHWALFLYKRKRYAESIAHFQTSLEKNNLQSDLWYRLGFAALTEEKWEISTTAYKQYCALEPDTFEAWNNMGKAYIKLGRYDFAFLAFQDAVKCNFDNWMVWENLMVSSARVHRLDEVIRCYHRILDLKGKHLDKQILELIVHSATNSSAPCQKIALQLFGRIVNFVNDADVWLLYADLADTNKDNTLESLETVLRYAKRAYAIRTRDNGWETDRIQFSSAVEITLKLADVYLRKSGIKQLSDKERNSSLIASKEIIQRILKRIELLDNDNEEWKKVIDVHSKSLHDKLHECTQFIIFDDNSKCEIENK